MDISNKTLAFFLVAAMIVSIAGTFISLNNMNRIQPGSKLGGLTGFATNETGNVTLQISKIASLRFANATLDWGSGSVDGSAEDNFCTMETNGSGWNNASCKDFNVVGSHLVLENNGSLFVDVKLNFSNTSALMFPQDTYNPILQYNVTENETNSCGTAGAELTQSTWNNTIITYEPIVCSNLSYADDTDSLAIEFKIGFSTQAAGGSRTLDVTAYGTEKAGQ